MTQRSRTQRLPPRRIGILGGTFDPIHRGHVDLGRAAQSALGLTQVFVVPTHIPPHRPQPIASSYHRFAMVALTVAGRAGWQATDVELGHDAPSYTSLTLRRFHERGFAPLELFFLIGADAFIEIGSWKDYPDILDQAHFAVVSRPGCPGDRSAAAPAGSGRAHDTGTRSGPAPGVCDLFDRGAHRGRVIYCDPGAARGWSADRGAGGA